MKAERRLKLNRETLRVLTRSLKMEDLRAIVGGGDGDPGPNIFSKNGANCGDG